MRCIDCSAITGDCVCLLDGEEKVDLNEERGKRCPLLVDYERAMGVEVNDK